MDSFSDDVKTVAEWARQSLTHDQLVDLFAESAVRAQRLESALSSVMESFSHLAEQENIRARALRHKAAELQLVEAMTQNKELLERLASQGVLAGIEHARKETSSRAAKAANAKHDQPGGSRDRAARIREAWTSGKYSSKDLCAEQECGALGMSFSSARKALRNVTCESPRIQ